MSQSTVTVQYTAGQTAGNLNVVVVGWNDSSAQISSVTDTDGNAYQLAVGPAVLAEGVSQAIYFAPNISATGSANAVTVAFDSEAAYPDIRILEYSAIDPVNPVDAAIGATGNSATTSSGALMTTAARDLLVGANTVQTAITGPGNGFTARLWTSPDGDIAEDQFVTATGSYSADAPLWNAGGWVMQMVAFRAAGQANSNPTPNPAPAPNPTPNSSSGTYTIPSTRTVTWQGNVGVKGGIPNRTTIYTTLSPSGGSDLSAIQNALQSCPANQVVMLNPGTYNMDSSLDWQNVNDGVVLRGSVDGNGVPTTQLIWSDGCIYMRSYFNENMLTEDNSVNLSADTVKGSNTIYLASVPSWIQPGQLYILDQLDDPSLVVNNGEESAASYREIMGAGARGMAQMVKVVSTSSNSITVEAPINYVFQTAFTAQITKGGYDTASNNPRRNCGVENLYMTASYSDGNTRFIRLENCDGCWVKNVQLYNQPGGIGILGDFCYRCEMRDSYINASQLYDGGEGYGIALYDVCSGCLIENNILEHLHVALQVNYGSSGNVYGYNYEKSGYPDAQQDPAIDSHGTHPMMNLFEGNYCEDKVLFDFIHGSGSHETVFRNRVMGWQPTNGYDQEAVEICEYNRHCNIVGNILGTVGVHNIYNLIAPDPSYTGSTLAIYVLGYSNVGYDDAATCDVLRADNYNTVNGAIPASESISNQALPNSLYLTGKPAFFNSLPWPAFDPNNPSGALLTNIPAGYRYVNGHPPQ
ncbi:MAG: hypothetical protein JO334_06680 [Verrucomicrobia bacterium]|nr:hypothetical protein [Verrucomicrobiota bacterium]